MRELGISGSFINRFHSVFSGKTADEYEQARDIVDYNIMFEDEENTAFENAAYKVGLYPLSISAIEPVAAEDGHKYRYIIHGSEITENTVIAVNGHVYDIEFEDRNTAYFNTNNRLNENDLILLRIIGERNGTVLCESREFSYRDKTLIGAQNKSGDGYEDDMRLELAADA